MTENIIHLGDSRELLYLVEDNSIDCVITDPPYGVNFWSRSAITHEGKKWVKKVENDTTVDGALDLFFEVMVPIVEEKMKDDADLYVFTRWDIVGQWIDAVQQLPGIEYKMMLVWDKGTPGMGDIDSNWGCGHELILYCKKGRRDVDHRRSAIIAVDRVAPAHIIHPTEKPSKLIEVLVKMSTKPGEVVLDPFSGSGSTAVAAKDTGRHSIGFEIDEDHYRHSTERLTQGTLF